MQFVDVLDPPFVDLLLPHLGNPLDLDLDCLAATA